jgi:hypothetical protein
MLLSKKVLMFGNKHNVEGAALQSEHILTDNKKYLSRPTDVINYVAMTLKNVKETLSLGDSDFTEAIIEQLVGRTESITEYLLPKRTPREKRLSPQGWRTLDRISQTKERLTTLKAQLWETLQDRLFGREDADTLVTEAREIDNYVKSREEHFKVELVAESRLQMCTIGSSHKLPKAGRSEEGRGTIAGAMDRLRVFDDDDLLDDEEGPGGDIDDEGPGKPDVVVIFDEAGCIPSYELLGLSRLGCKIVGLVVVGDIHQLPPYDPGSGCRNSQGRSILTAEKVHSLLNVSALTTSDSKVTLTTQYRVPRDIAELLNHRIYRGKYQTPPTATVPDKGFHFVHVPYCERKKYVNENEIETALELIHRSQIEGYDSIIVLTPVSAHVP